MEHTIRVLLCGDPVTGQQVRQSLDKMPSVQTAGQAGSSSAGAEMARRLRPGLILLSLPLPDQDGPAAARLLLSSAPGAKLLGLSEAWTTAAVQEMLSLGASGCLLADTDRVELARAIQVVMFGGQYLGPCLTQAEPRTLPQHGTGVAQIRI